MAGAILPPELLGRIVACHIEDKLESLYDDEEEEEEESEPEQAVFVPVLSPTEARIWEHFRNQEALMRERKPRRGNGGAQDDAESDDREPGLAFSSGITCRGSGLRCRGAFHRFEPQRRRRLNGKQPRRRLVNTLGQQHGRPLGSTRENDNDQKSSDTTRTKK